jgi:tRNA A-37 threonylcarbamoyl transferase component Bud32
MPVTEPRASVGRYEPIRRLAVGGMAEIFLARVPGVGIEGFEKLVVLKKILPQHALDPELLRMFLDEARLSATLTHPHVTQVHDVGTDGDAPFFAMEYVHGANLRELMRAQARRAELPLPLGPALAIVAAAADGLHHAHERLGPGGEPLGIVHRDVSPSNVLVSFDGGVKVSDFGIAKWAYQRTQTQEGTLKGKFAYMSPEQCRGRAVDRRSDIFALGTILYELTTGAPPFAAESDLEILNQIANGTAQPPAWPAARGTYPPALAAIVMRALAPDPDQRFATMRELQVAIEGFAREAGLALSTVGLAALMNDLFAEELAAWHAAQRAGKTLGDHLAASPAPARDLREERTATDAFAKTVPRRPARARVLRVAGLAAFAAVFATAGGLAAKRWRPDHVAPVVAAPAVPLPAPPGRAPALTADRGAVPTLTTAERGDLPSLTLPTERGAPARGTPPAPRRRARTGTRVDPAPPTAPAPAPETRLRTWDPDSPRPP